MYMKGWSHLPTNGLPIVSFAYITFIYRLIAYMHFCTQIKILETELLLATCIIAYMYTFRKSSYKQK